MSVAVEFRNVSKHYRLGLTRTSLLSWVSQSVRKIVSNPSPSTKDSSEIWALQDISFRLDRGESLGLIGRNGAGKSTMLKLLARITEPTTGTVVVDGTVAALIELGSGFHPDLTGRQNIYLNGTILGLTRKEIDRRFDEIVDFSEVARFIETPVKRYSSGMLVRLGFAVASCIDPDILLVDEVLAVGDAPFRQKCLARIEQLSNKGTSIVFVSHNLYMVQSVCKTSLYFDKGRLKYVGATQDAIDMYERDVHAERADAFTGTLHEGPATSSTATINHVDVVNRTGETTDTFRSGEYLEVRIHYGTVHPGERLNASVRIVRSDGVTCCTMRTAVDGVELFLPGRRGTFGLVMDNHQLTRGSYFIEARILNEKDNVVLGSCWSRPFFVSAKALSHELHSGVFEPQKRWTEVSTGLDGDETVENGQLS